MKKQKRLLSILLSLALTFTTLFGNLGAAKAASGRPAKSDTLVKLNDAKKVLVQRFDKSKELNKNSSINPEEEVRVIIQSKNASSFEIAAKKNLKMSDAVKMEDNIKAGQASLISNVKHYGQVRHQYANVINGISANVKYKDIEKIKKLPGVKKVTIANVYYPDMSTAAGLSNIPEVWESLKLKGEGTVVSIVDSGIDVTHQDMVITDKAKAKLDKTAVTAIGGPGKFYTDKVPYGYNYADMNDIIIDRGSAGMHGMHVSGIVAANGNVKGVAPEAQLLALKVFSNNKERGGAYTDDITAAIEDSVRHGADVINMSLGATAGFVDPEDPEQIAIKNAVDNGVIVVVSGGNSYFSTYPNNGALAQDPDTGLVGSPGLGLDTIQVASFENTKMMVPAFDYKAGTETGNMIYSLTDINPLGILEGEYELVDCGIGDKADFQGKELTGKIALIIRGSLNFTDKQINAQNAGAVGVIVYNHADGGDALINMAMHENLTIPAIFIGSSDGLKLKGLIASGVKVSFPEKVLQVDNPNSNYMSDFSSWGPTPDLSFKPEVTAPGGNIYSTVNNNKYENMSGTSMSSPHTAGVTALVVQYLKSQNVKINGKAPTGREFAELAKKLIMNTAEPIYDPDSELPYVTRKQGAGLVKVNNAIKTKVFVTTENGKAAVELKEIGNQKQFKLIFNNFGDTPHIFIPKDNYSVLTSWIYDGKIYPYTDIIAGAAIAFDKTEVTVPAGGTAELNVTLTIPEGTTKNIFAEGFITLESKGNTNVNLGIPYMGFYGEWDAPRIFDDPFWMETSYYQETLLATKLNIGPLNGYYGMGADYKHFSMSPDGDGYFDNVIPNVSFLRNAKEFKVQIVDSNKNVVRELINDTYYRKNYGTSSAGVSKLLTDATWDGTIFDKTTNQYKIADDGQYFIKLSGRIDFEDSKWTSIEMPINVDLTAPELSITSGEVPTGQNEYLVKWTSNDTVGIEFYEVYLNGENITPKGIAGDAVSYSVTNLKNGINTIDVAAYDYAGNVSIAEVKVDNTLIKFNVEKDILINKSEVTIDYEINSSILSLVDHTDVVVDGNAINNGTKSSITIEKLKDGEHTVVFNVYDSKNALLATDTIKVKVDTVFPTVKLFDMNGDSLNDAELNIKSVDAQIVPSESLKSLKMNINGIETEVTKIEDLKYTAKLVFAEGVNKVSVTAEDIAGNINGYAYRIYADTIAPDLNIIAPENIDKPIILGKDVTSYKLAIQCQDNTVGYILYVNGSQIGNAYNDLANGTDVKTFEYSYNNIPTGKSFVEVKLVDLFGNETVKTITFFKDANAPEITVTSPADNSTVKGKKVTVEGKVTDNSAATLTINEKEVTLKEDGSFIYEISYENYGTKKITLVATDEALNKTTKEITINVVEADVEGVTIKASANTVEIGKSIDFNAEALLKDKTAKDVTAAVSWKVSDATKAKFEGNKLVALASGTVNVYAEINGVKSNTIAITVNTPADVKKDVLLVTVSCLNVRQSATTSSTRLGCVYRGQMLELLGKTNNWYKINFNGKIGYVYYRYVQQAQYIEYRTAKQVTVTAYALNVRKYPSILSARYGSLRRGTKVTVLGYVNGWYKINFNGKTAYIDSRYVTQISNTGNSTSKQVTVTASALNVRKSPTVNSAKYGLLYRGAKVTVLDYVNGWYKINYKGKTAYICARYTK